MIQLIHESLLSFNVKCRASDPVTRDTGMSDVQLRLRIGGMDRRKVRFKGWVTIENFVYGNVQGSFVVMQRDEVSISTLTDDITPYRLQLPGFSTVLATVVESINQARRHQPPCFEEIAFIPCRDHIPPAHAFVTPIRRACLSFQMVLHRQSRQDNSNEQADGQGTRGQTTIR